MQLYLYDPMNNVKTPTSYKLLSGITGMNKGDLAVYKSRRNKLGALHRYIVDEKTTKEELYELMLKEKPKDEIWKNVENEYQISNYGRFRRLYKSKGPRLLMPYRKKNKWLVVKIHGKEVEIHKLVAHAFLEVPEGKCIYHKNENIWYNHVSNIGFATRKELGEMFGGSSSKGIPVSKIDLDTGEVLDEYDNMAVAGRENYMSREAIRLAIEENRPSCGFGWKKCANWD